MSGCDSTSENERVLERFPFVVTLRDEPTIQEKMAAIIEASKAGTVPENNSQDDETIIKKLGTIAEKYKDEENVPDCIEELIEDKKMNYLVLDLYDFEEGFELSVFEHHDCNRDLGGKEIFFGKYPYGVPLLDNISNGEIPYELFDKLREYHCQLIYDGHLVVKLLIYIGRKCKRVHFALLRPSIKTIFGESEINLKGKTCTKLEKEEEKARLIAKYSPDLRLIPDPRVSDIAMSYPQFPFISPRIKSVLERQKIHKENAIRIRLESEESSTCSKLDGVIKSYNPEEDNMIKFLLDYSEFKELPARQELDFKDWTSKYVKQHLTSYLKNRKIHLPDRGNVNGSYVEIEVFVFNYGTFNGNDKVVQKCDKLHVSVLNCKEVYYCSYEVDSGQKALDRTEEGSEIGDRVALGLSEVGDRKALDLFIRCFALLRIKNFVENMKMTHEQKLKPETHVVLSYPPSEHEAKKVIFKDEEMFSSESSGAGSPAAPLYEYLDQVFSENSTEF